MRVLNSTEIAVVNGAGIGATIGSVLGTAISFVAGLFGSTLDFKTAFQFFGTAIDSLISFDLSTAFQSFMDGVKVLFPIANTAD